jgi:MFS family permease
VSTIGEPLPETPGAQPPRRGIRGLFQRSGDPLGSNYRKLWTASAISNLGDGVRWTALPLLGASITRDPAKIAAIDLFATLPWFLFALLAGALVDRWDKRLAMAIANGVRFLLVLGLALATLWGAESLLLIYVVGFLMGCSETIFDNSAQTILPAIVRKDQLERANGRLYAAEIINNQFVGPPLGGFLFAAAAAAPFFLDSASFLISALLIAVLVGSFRSPRDETAGATTIRTDIAEGLKWLWNHRLIRTLAIMLGIWNGVSMAGFAIFVLFALEILGLDEVGYGILLGASTVGSLIGSMAASRLSKAGAGTTLIAMVTLGALSSLGIGLTSSAIVVGLMSAIFGFTSVVWNVITVSLRQAIIPDRLLGRVNSVYRLLGWGSMPVGAALGGVMGSTLGLRSPFIMQAIVLILMAIVALPIINNKSIAAARAAAENS